LPNNRSKLLGKLPDEVSEALLRSWDLFIKGYQQPPACTPEGVPWTTWLLMGGRGAGKTCAGAEWVRGVALDQDPFHGSNRRRIALVGETEHDVREVMIEGETGLLRLHARCQRPQWIPSRKRLQWINGAVAYAFSADDPESLRGSQFDAAWCDELAKWRYAQHAFDMLQFGMRLGVRPRQVITTTPRPIPLIKRLIDDRRTVVTRAATHVNAINLSPVFLDTVVAHYDGTALGRQELDGEIIDERPGALWSRALIEACRVDAAPELEYIVLGVDPPGSARHDGAACGIVAAGRAEDGRIYVLADETVAGLSPNGWATKAVDVYHRLKANLLIAEVNMGGDMVRAVIHGIDERVPVRSVHATRGKYLRAEPVASKYERNKVKHVGCFRELEDEMCEFGYEGLASGRSPDRLDALVWALTALIGPATQAPRIRML
jgi:phage terminase large subunit-like protein